MSILLILKGYIHNTYSAQDASNNAAVNKYRTVVVIDILLLLHCAVESY